MSWRRWEDAVLSPEPDAPPAGDGDPPGHDTLAWMLDAPSRFASR